MKVIFIGSNIGVFKLQLHLGNKYLKQNKQFKKHSAHLAVRYLLMTRVIGFAARKQPETSLFLKKQIGKQSGFTLLELMIAALLSSFLALAISSVMIFSVEWFDVLVQQQKTEEQMLWTSYHLRSYLSQAVNIQTKNTGPSCHIDQSDIGNLQDQGFIIPGPCTNSDFPNIALVAIFPREQSFKYSTVDLFHTSIFYQKPTQNTSGTLSIGIGERTGSNNYIHTFNSSDNITYRGLSGFEIRILPMDAANICQRGTTVSCSGSKPMAKMAQIILRFRYFLFTDGDSGVRHDYTADIRTISARDLTSTIDINFHNNTMIKCQNMTTGCNSNSNSTGKERVLGGIYLYKVVLPPTLFKL